MSYINNIKARKGGFNKMQVNSLTYEVDKLLKMYPSVTLKSLNILDPESGHQAEHWEGVISIDVENPYFTNEAEANRIRNAKRKHFLEKHSDAIKKRKDILGIELVNNNPIWDGVRTIKGAIRHEFAHLLDYTYNLTENERINELYESLDWRLIKDNLSYFANENVTEFIAISFEESFYGNCSKLAKDVRKLIDEVIKERKA